MTNEITTAQVQAMFEILGASGSAEDFGAQWVTPIWKSARDSDRARAVAIALAPMLAQSITAAGIDPRPTLRIICYGIALGLRYAQDHPHAGDPFTEFMEKLHQEGQND